MSEETYKLKAICSNCDFNEEIEIPKGTKIKDMDCPHCGCKELSRSYEDVVIRPQYENFS